MKYIKKELEEFPKSVWRSLSREDAVETISALQINSFCPHLRRYCGISKDIVDNYKDDIYKKGATFCSHTHGLLSQKKNKKNKKLQQKSVIGSN